MPACLFFHVIIRFLQDEGLSRPARRFSGIGGYATWPARCRPFQSARSATNRSRYKRDRADRVKTRPERLCSNKRPKRSRSTASRQVVMINHEPNEACGHSGATPGFPESPGQPLRLSLRAAEAIKYPIPPRMCELGHLQPRSCMQELEGIVTVSARSLPLSTLPSTNAHGGYDDSHDPWPVMDGCLGSAPDASGSSRAARSFDGEQTSRSCAAMRAACGTVCYTRHSLAKI
jgi:hypothetical protein